MIRQEYSLILLGVIAVMSNCAADLEIVTRAKWGAKPSKGVQPMKNPVDYVIIHHSYQPSACYTLEDCSGAMRWMQDLHQINNSWNDIGYSFAVGSDGRVYEGRGWSAVGAHSPGYNNKSIGICLIGDWSTDLPPEPQVRAVKKLIQLGIEQNYIRPEYKLHGHRQVRETECPGNRLFSEIQTWEHFCPSQNDISSKKEWISKKLQTNLQIVTREQWGAKPPKGVEPMKNPVDYVIIHHSYQPSACYTLEDCSGAMRWMQDLHQINNSWNDIGYSFAVGSDGRAYEGRGWSAVGAHAPGYNDKSIGICLIGDWRFDLPPTQHLEAVKNLIQLGIEQNYINPKYILHGHRQVRETECPGDRLFAEIQTWDHFTEGPDEIYTKKEGTNEWVLKKANKNIS